MISYKIDGAAEGERDGLNRGSAKTFSAIPFRPFSNRV